MNQFRLMRLMRLVRTLADKPDVGTMWDDVGSPCHSRRAAWLLQRGICGTPSCGMMWDAVGRGMFDGRLMVSLGPVRTC